MENSKHVTELNRPLQCAAWLEIDSRNAQFGEAAAQQYFAFRALGPMGSLYNIFVFMSAMFKEYGFDMATGKFAYEMVGDNDQCKRHANSIRNLAQLSYILHMQTNGEKDATPEALKALWQEADVSAYQIHLDKNADYSPYNILVTGEIGCLVRMWDKVARLMNLYGIDVGTGKLKGAKDPHVKDESIKDTWADLRNYAQIYLLLIDGKWGE